MAVADISVGVVQEVQGRSLWADARHRFLRNKAAVASLIVFGLIVVACFGAPYFVRRAQAEIDRKSVV